MASIRVLPEQLVNQIAAGEVIERPASVVKELLENAIDAEATRITVELEEAGKKLIRVSDNGRGIPPDEAPLALASHATSKIASAEDLEAIGTLGFRGEALASIASVADVRLVTRTAGALEATEVSVSAGKSEPARPASGPVGTLLEVRNLFRYVPARRKFLKTDATEMGHISEQVARIALPYPAVHLTVTHGGRTVYELPPTDSVRERIGAFFGADLAHSLIEIASEEPAGRLWGLVGTPQTARATTATQYLFINGRYVRDRALLHALREAYRGLLEGTRQPVAFLFLSVPPDRVDVNVHPTKIEVRLRDAHLLYGQVLAGVRERLLGPGITPHLAPPEEGPPAAQAAERAPVPPGMPSPAEGGPDAVAAPPSPPRDDRIKQAVADFLQSPKAVAQARLGLQGQVSAARAKEKVPGTFSQAPSTQHAAEAEPLGRIHAIQIHNTYLVAETPDGILIVDQHALHERVLFEEIMRRMEAGPLESQRMLVPVPVDVTDREAAALETYADSLARLGIEVEPLGPRTIGIQGFPMLLEKADPAGTLRDFLAWVLACERPPDVRQVLERLAHVAACRGAVKAGDPLRAEEMAALLAHREAARMAATCPHGRPTALLLKRTDLEKQFGRDYAASGGKPSDEPLPF